MVNLVIWMNMPSHHQSEFLSELSKLTKLKVFYTGNLDARRVNDGWIQPQLKDFEYLTVNFFTIFKYFILNRHSVHVIPGCGSLTNCLLFLLAFFLNTKWVHLSESFPLEGRGLLKNFIFRFYYNSVNFRSLGAFGIGDLAVKSLLDVGVSDNKIRKTNYSSPIDGFVNREKANSDKLKIIVLGRLCENKGTNLIIDCFKNGTKIDVDVDFYGSISSDFSSYLEQIVASDTMNYKGVVNSNDVNNILLDYHVLLFPTHNDGWGMVATEAVNSGLPVITTKHAGCAGLIVKHKFNGLIIDASSDEIYAAILKYYMNNNLIYEHSSNSILLANEFSPINTAGKFYFDIMSLNI